MIPGGAAADLPDVLQAPGLDRAAHPIRDHQGHRDPGPAPPARRAPTTHTALADELAQYLPPDPASRPQYVAGEIAEHVLWFPPIELPVGFGQTRTPTQLPVLTMITGYARWLSAVLIPSRRAEDLFAGWWQLLERLGAVPRVLVWDGE